MDTVKIQIVFLNRYIRDETNIEKIVFFFLKKRTSTGFKTENSYFSYLFKLLNNLCFFVLYKTLNYKKKQKNSIFIFILIRWHFLNMIFYYHLVHFFPCHVHFRAFYLVLLFHRCLRTIVFVAETI